MQHSNAHILSQYDQIYLSLELQEVTNTFSIHKWISWGSMELGNFLNTS